MSSKELDVKTEPMPGDDCIVVALKCLHQSDPVKKAHWTAKAYDLWKQHSILLPNEKHHGKAPDTPGRSPKVNLVPPSDLPRRGRGGSLASRQALLHSLVHIECSAIDLSWDIIARFGADPDYATVIKNRGNFFDEWIRVAADEARHFSLLLHRLKQTGNMDYGDLPAHDGLWETAMETSKSLPARLAVEHCVHEARGLDILPQTIARFRAGGDEESANLLENIIYREEITHCAAGITWFKALFEESRRWHCHIDDVGNKTTHPPQWVEDAKQYETVEEWFHALVRRHFHGFLKPPFNDEARAEAGFLPAWYHPLTT